jgi:hypothetical protein
MAYHDGLPASMPAPGFAGARFEYNRAYWRHGSISAEPYEYFSGGLRIGQEWRKFCLEEGLTVLNPGVILPCLEGGVGLREPAVTLRFLWTPVTLGSQVDFDPMLWWQVSALAGTPRKSRGLGISGGARASRVGIGPMTVLDYSHSGISFRVEGSMTFPSPWADVSVQGRVLTFGLSVEPTQEIPRK